MDKHIDRSQFPYQWAQPGQRGCASDRDDPVDAEIDPMQVDQLRYGEHGDPGTELVRFAKEE
ncbi:hypothetical protein D3C75_998220 [compost metagenome]